MTKSGFGKAIGRDGLSAVGAGRIKRQVEDPLKMVEGLPERDNDLWYALRTELASEKI